MHTRCCVDNTFIKIGAHPEDRIRIRGNPAGTLYESKMPAFIKSAFAGVEWTTTTLPCPPRTPVRR